MGKRIARSQLTKDRPEDYAESDDDVKIVDISSIPVSERKISKPRRPSERSSVKSTPYAANKPFTGFAGFGSNANSFDVLQTASFASSTASNPDTKASQPAQPIASTNTNDYNLHLRGLNVSFIKTIQEATAKSPAMNLEQYLSQYLKHLGEINVKFGPKKDEKASTIPSTNAPFTFPPIPSLTFFENPSNQHPASINPPQTKSFSFTNNPSSLSLPTFGTQPAAIEPTKPFSFSFGATAGTMPKSTSNSFAPEMPKPFTFSLPPLTFPSATLTAEKDHGKDEDNENISDDHDDAMAEDTNEPTIQLADTRAGEEHEDTEFEERTRLFVLDKTKGYVDLGVGTMKINIERADSIVRKARALWRAEGTGKIMLNAALRKEIKTEYKSGEKQLALICLNLEGRPAKYLVRLKTVEAAEKLNTVIRSRVDNVNTGS